MKNNLIALAIEKPKIAIDTEKVEASRTASEAVARFLGYTEKESDLAGGILMRFAWRRPTSHENN